MWKSLEEVVASSRNHGGIVVFLFPGRFNIFAPENIPYQKERIVFQPSSFRGELLNFGFVFCLVYEGGVKYKAMGSDPSSSYTVAP